MIQLAEADENRIQNLGKPQVAQVSTSDERDVSVMAEVQQASNDKQVVIIWEEVDSEKLEGCTFCGNMSYPQHCPVNHGFHQGLSVGRGAFLPPRQPQSWNQPQWDLPVRVPFIPSMNPPMRPIPGAHYHPNYAVSVYHWSKTFQPPSMPPGTRSESFLLTPRHQPSSDLGDVCPLSASMGDIGSFAPNFQLASLNPNFKPLEPVHRSLSPDIRDVLADDGSDEVEPPVLINVPQLSG